MDLRTNLKQTKKNLAEYGKYRLQNNQLMVKTLVELKGNFVGSIGGNQHLDKKLSCQEPCYFPHTTIYPRQQL